MNKKLIFITLVILIVGIYLRLFHINFGLPQSFYADEPEFVEPAINYTYQLKDIIKNNNYYKLIPISFVYGTFPTYLLSILVMGFSKLNNVFHIVFGKTELYTFSRIITAIIPFILINFSLILLTKRLFKNNWVSITSTLLFSLNWKFIVHAHYVNADILLTTLLMLALTTLFLYFEKQKDDTIYTVFTGILLGLAVGTKITAFITIPLFLYIYLLKKDYKGIIGLTCIALTTYIITNPFSFILFSTFSFRVFEMFTKEGGLVFDSVDTRFYKYILALAFIATPSILVLSLWGMFRTIKEKYLLNYHYVLIGSIIIYILFFSMQARRVDRWLLPILPIIILYASYGIFKLKELNRKYFFLPIIVITAIVYLYYPLKLLTEFQRETPKSAAYIWMKNNINPYAKKLVYTEEGLDPMNKLETTKVYKIEVYSSENAQYFYPIDPKYFDYIVLSSRPMQNYKRKEIRQAYPLYFQKWQDFENSINNPTKFSLIKSFTLPKPNLIPLSDVYIYKNLTPSEYKADLFN